MLFREYGVFFFFSFILVIISHSLYKLVRLCVSAFLNQLRWPRFALKGEGGNESNYVSVNIYIGFKFAFLLELFLEHFNGVTIWLQCQLLSEIKGSSTCCQSGFDVSRFTLHSIVGCSLRM